MEKQRLEIEYEKPETHQITVTMGKPTYSMPIDEVSRMYFSEDLRFGVSGRCLDVVAWQSKVLVNPGLKICRQI